MTDDDVVDDDDRRGAFALSSGQRLMLALSQSVVGGLGASLCLGVIIGGLFVLGSGGWDGAILNMLLLPATVASVAAGTVVARRVRRLQERRLQAAWRRPPRGLQAAGGTDSPVAVRD